MPALQVRDFPEDLYEDLRAKAKENHRSFTQETIVAVKQYLLSGNTFKLLDLEEGAKEGASDDKQKAPQNSYYTIQYSACHVKDLPEHSRKRRQAEVLATLRAQPIVIDPKDFPSSVELVREDRDNR